MGKAKDLTKRFQNERAIQKVSDPKSMAKINDEIARKLEDMDGALLDVRNLAKKFDPEKKGLIDTISKFMKLLDKELDKIDKFL